MPRTMFSLSLSLLFSVAGRTGPWYFARGLTVGSCETRNAGNPSATTSYCSGEICRHVDARDVFACTLPMGGGSWVTSSCPWFPPDVANVTAQ